MYAEFERIPTFIEERWGNLPKAWTNTRVMAEEFKRFTAGAVLEALHELFREGTDFTPKPPSVYKRALIVQSRRYDEGTDERPARECRGSHVWAVVHYPGKALIPDGCDELSEHQWCALCHEERLLRRVTA